MTDSIALLNQSSAVLTQANPHSNAVACWIARAALESVVDDLLTARGRSAPQASMRSKLSVLQVAFEDTDLPARAEYAWSRLSQACHHHAFQLTPVSTEVRHLIDLVGSLPAAIAGSSN